MAGYFGTPRQQSLQKAAEARAELIRETPGACQNGRMAGCDDLDRLGWERIDAALDEDGACGFRLIPAGRAGDLAAHLAERGFRLDTWDVFVGARETVLAVAKSIIARGLPAGLADLDRPSDPEGADTARIQALIGAAGVVPFSGSLLVGAAGPATTVSIGRRDGTIAAAAHGYLPHNRHSPWRSHAWAGLVAVAEAERGKGLGVAINARIVAAVFRDLGASHVYELVSATNEASRRMVAACGLAPRPDLLCGIAIPDDSPRFTR